MSRIIIGFPKSIFSEPPLYILYKLYILYILWKMVLLVIQDIQVLRRPNIFPSMGV